jgi:mannosyltransferase OCH1-like enzyme
MKIPRIIHQIWSGIEEPLPEYYANLCAATNLVIGPNLVI